MFGSQPCLEMALIELRMEEARRTADAHRMVTLSGRRVGRQAGLFLAGAGAWLVSLGQQVAHTTRVQPSI